MLPLLLYFSVLFTFLDYAELIITTLGYRLFSLRLWGRLIFLSRLLCWTWG